MEITTVIEIGQKAVYNVLLIIAPVLGLGLITGLLVAILQATTQIQEQTLAFVPKIMVVLMAIGFFGPWMLATFIDFVTNLFHRIPEIVS